MRLSIPLPGPRRGRLALAALLAGVPWIMGAGSTVSLTDGWFRVLTPTLPAAGYFTLTNATDQPVQLVGASSSACGQTMLHRSTNENGVEHMAMVASVTVPAHGSLAFRPGGYHIMCMSPGPALTPGHTVPVALRFADGTSLQAEFRVLGATGK
jgi:hypothetical protein